MAQTIKWGKSNIESLSPLNFQERTMGYDIAFPSQWIPNGWFFRTDENQKYQNTGTLAAPVWTLRMGSGGFHIHSTADGGKLDGDLTTVTINGVDLTLLEFMVL